MTVIALALGLVLAGLVGALMPALGYFPALGSDQFTLAPIKALAQTPGLATSVAHSFLIGFTASLGSFILIITFTAAYSGRRLFHRVQKLLSPLLALPHAAAAFALAFLIAPSGWLVRLLSPWATGWTRPPDVLIVHDPHGLTMLLALIAKETPFLFLMLLAALPQVRAADLRKISASAGYAPITGWLKTVFPQVYPQMRLPLLAVIAYSTSVVDVAIILGPMTPAPLSVRVIEWMNAPDLQMRYVASAGAVLQALVSLAAIGLWLLLERIVRIFGRRWCVSGQRRCGDVFLARASLGLILTLLAALLAAIIVLLLWSFTSIWRFPDAFPASLTLARWRAALPGLSEALSQTLWIGAPVTLAALILTIGCLELETRGKTRLIQQTATSRKQLLLYLPLIVPQIAFLFGLQFLMAFWRLDANIFMVMMAHLVFVLPYVFLSLSAPWHALDPRYAALAAGLGASSWRILWRIRLPMLTRALASAGALGFAVSTAQYLPTLLIGGGRVETITTEAVALSSGGDRRLIAIYAVLQMTLPYAGFCLAALIPTILFRKRKALRS